MADVWEHAAVEASRINDAVDVSTASQDELEALLGTDVGVVGASAMIPDDSRAKISREAVAL